jgi:DNA repair exonuclease SbcCD ATPase subunit
MYSSSASRPLRPAYHEALPESAHGVRRDVDDLFPLPPGHKKSRRSDAEQPNAVTSDVPSSSQTAELNKHYESLSKEHEFVRGELRARLQELKEKDYLIGSLKAELIALQRNHGKQSTALADVRHELRSCQSQLDNVQRFISTADTHADQDIIQMLQALNEEVYQMSMTMADNVTENFARTARQTKEHPSVGEHVLAAIGQAMVDSLAAVEGGEDIALFLQIAFQSFLSRLLHQIVSSWTIGGSHNELIEGTYQRLRKAGEIIRCSIRVKHSD